MNIRNSAWLFRIPLSLVQRSNHQLAHFLSEILNEIQVAKGHRKTELAGTTT
jgi:hypothetical protein